MANHIGRAYHVNLNCSDLDRAATFWCERVGLTPLTRTAPTAPQPGSAFGLDEVQWDAWILGGDRSLEGTVLDLLEWKVPQPTGMPPGPAPTPGMWALVVDHPDVEAVAASARRLSSDPPGRVAIADADGSVIHLRRAEQRGVTGLEIGVSELDASIAFYRDVLGLELVDRDASGVDNRRRALLADAATGFEFGLTVVGGPSGHGRRPANGLGLFRTALFTDDIHAAHRELVAADVVCLSPPAQLEMGPGLPSDLWALFFEDPDGACIELIES